MELTKTVGSDVSLATVKVIKLLVSRKRNRGVDALVSPVLLVELNLVFVWQTLSFLEVVRYFLFKDFIFILVFLFVMYFVTLEF